MTGTEIITDVSVLERPSSSWSFGRERRQHAPGREAEGEGDRRQDQVSIRVARHGIAFQSAGTGPVPPVAAGCGRGMRPLVEDRAAAEKSTGTLQACTSRLKGQNATSSQTDGDVGLEDEA